MHPSGEAVARRFYTDDELAEVPAGAVGLSLSAKPRPLRIPPAGRDWAGRRLGGGIDSILAARRVGPEGSAVGLDILKESGARSRCSPPTLTCIQEGISDSHEVRSPR
jgi:hypothetical protein